MTQGTNGCMRGDETEEVPRVYYFSAKPVSTRLVQSILEEAAKTTKSSLQLNLERTLNCGAEGKSVTDSLKGMFYRQIRNISFNVSLAEEGANMFEGIEFSAFELQDFNEDRELGKYVNSLIKAIDAAYKKFLSQK